MTRYPEVEFSEGTYATLWSAILKTGDKDSLNLFKSVIHMERYPVLHYRMEKGLLFGFVDEIVECDYLQEVF